MAENRSPSGLGRQAAKAMLRSYGELTAGLRPSPDFIVIGAKRGGTTSVYNYILEHPSVQPLFPGRQRIKGAHYFDSEYERGDRWYRSHFPLTVAGRALARPWLSPAISGEASPYYLFHPLAASRLAQDCPDVKLIVLLRDPVERAYSHYKERVRHGAEPLSFEAALAAEPDRLRGEEARIIRQAGYRSVEHEDHSYLAQGRYLDMLPRWFEIFGRDRFFIAASEEFYADPGRVVGQAWQFLGLPDAKLRSQRKYNYHPAADLAPELRERLRDEFAEHNQELEELLGRKLPWPGPRRRAIVSRGADPAGPAERWPAVSVVVATRDRPELLERAVSSILGQDYPGPIECAVVFDQSAPRQLDVATRVDRRLRVLANHRTPGLAGARNTGITGTDEPLIAFCDDDDAWLPDKLRAQVDLLRQADAEFAAGGIRIHHGDHLNVRIPPVAVGFEQLVRDRVAALHPSTFLFRRSVLGELGLVDEAIPGSYGEDYDWLLRAASRMPVVAVQRPVADIYWHPQSFFAERWATVADALQYLLAKHPQLAADRAGRARILGQISFAQAALAQRASAVRSSWTAIRGNPGERRAYLALAVAAGVLPATVIVRLANSRGRGI